MVQSHTEVGAGNWQEGGQGQVQRCTEGGKAAVGAGTRMVLETREQQVQGVDLSGGEWRSALLSLWKAWNKERDKSQCLDLHIAEAGSEGWLLKSWRQMCIVESLNNASNIWKTWNILGVELNWWLQFIESCNWRVSKGPKSWIKDSKYTLLTLINCNTGLNLLQEAGDGVWRDVTVWMGQILWIGLKSWINLIMYQRWKIFTHSDIVYSLKTERKVNSWNR